jgi:hypothetical protein
MTRQCARPGCSATAAATLAYDYQQRMAWLDRLAPEAHPMSYDLCDAHADALVVPRGWRVEDRRDTSAGRVVSRVATASFEDALAF